MPATTCSGIYIELAGAYIEQLKRFVQQDRHVLFAAGSLVLILSVNALSSIIRQKETGGFCNPPYNFSISTCGSGFAFREEIKVPAHEVNQLQVKQSKNH